MDIPTLILDNGGYSIKAGLANQSDAKLIPNCVSKVKSERRRLFIGDQIDECKDYSGLFYLLPIAKGFITNYDTQRQVWEHVLRNRFELKDCEQHRVIITQPHFNFKQAQTNLYEIFFEEYGFGKLFSATSTCLASVNHQQQSNNESLSKSLSNITCLVVDSGYSFTHIVPYIDGCKIKSAIVRIDVGGKALTNYLKDVISYRQLHVLDETFVMNQCKEDCCFVSTDFKKDLQKCKQRNNQITRDYVLPDFINIRRGYVRDQNDSTPLGQDQQIVKMNNERIQVPEILFHPSDVGINQIGISNAIFYCIESLPEQYRAQLYQNIVLIGGNCCFSQFQERVQQDVRALADHVYKVKVKLPAQPIFEPWKGGQRLVNEYNSAMESRFVSRKEYNEFGLQRCMDAFDI